MGMMEAGIFSLMKDWRKEAGQSTAALLAELQRTNALLAALLAAVERAGGVQAAVDARNPYTQPGQPPVTVEGRYGAPGHAAPPSERRPRWGRS